MSRCSCVQCSVASADLLPQLLLFLLTRRVDAVHDNAAPASHGSTGGGDAVVVYSELDVMGLLQSVREPKRCRHQRAKRRRSKLARLHSRHTHPVHSLVHLSSRHVSSLSWCRVVSCPVVHAVSMCGGFARSWSVFLTCIDSSRADRRAPAVDRGGASAGAGRQAPSDTRSTCNTNIRSITRTRKQCDALGLECSLSWAAVLATRWRWRRQRGALKRRCRLPDRRQSRADTCTINMNVNHLIL